MFRPHNRILLRGQASRIEKKKKERKGKREKNEEEEEEKREGKKRKGKKERKRNAPGVLRGCWRSCGRKQK